MTTTAAPTPIALVAADVRYTISVAIERQQQAGGIDAVAYGLLLTAQAQLDQLSSK